MKHPLYIAIILILTSCTSKIEEQVVTPNGLWQQVGYGKIVEIQDSILRVYDICQTDCHMAFEEEILDFGRILKVSKDSLTIKHNIDHWEFLRIETLPKLCLDTIDLSHNPEYNFETFWHTFDEHYCSFEIKDINWDEVYDEYRPKISGETSDLALFQIFEEMTSLLNDGHVSIDLPDEIEVEYKEVTEPKEKRYSIFDEFQLQQDLANLYVDSLRSYNGGVVRWGSIGEVGYIQFNTMWMMANYGIDPGLGLMETYQLYAEAESHFKDEEQRENEAQGADYIMNTILTELSGAKAFILDLRFNGGGKDCVAMEVINHLSGENRKAFKKYVSYLDTNTAHQEFELNPSANHFSGKVVVLTSRQTASAAEVAVLATLSNPNFIRIGSNTEGIFSSTLDKTLPNLWEYELSNEVYTDLDGNNYENVGVEPDVLIEYSADKDSFMDQLKLAVDSQEDEAIKIALTRLRN